jgi:very-short-patch-repair endonuclease
LRFWNHEVLQNTQGVLQTIVAALQAPLPSGEGGARRQPGG